MSYDFNGGSDHLELGSAIVSAVPLTLFARIITDTVAAGTQTILSISGSSGTHIFQLRRNGRDIEAATSEGGTTVSAISAGGGMSVGQTVSAMAVFAANDSRKAYHTISETGTNASSATPTSLDRTNIGSRYNAAAVGSFFDGKICEAAIWSAALTDDDYHSLWAGCSPLVVRPAALEAYFPLIRGTNDLTASRSLNVTGAVVAEHMRGRRPSNVI